MPCYPLSCGHFLCEPCILVSVEWQLQMRNHIICPAPACTSFVYFSNLSNAGQEMYFEVLLLDFAYKTTDRRSIFAKSVAVACRHKHHVITSLATLSVVGLTSTMLSLLLLL